MAKAERAEMNALIGAIAGLSPDQTEPEFEQRVAANTKERLKK